MACERAELPGGGVAMMCSRGKRSKKAPCACGNEGTHICDFPIGGVHKRTCDVPLCAQCLTKGGGGDLCRKHAQEWKEKLGVR